MRRHRFISMTHVAIRRCTEQRRLCTVVAARLKPIKRKQMRRKRV